MHMSAAFAGYPVDALWHVMCLHWATHVHYDAGGIAVTLRKQLWLVALFGVQATALAQTPTTADLFDGSVLHEVRMTMSPYAWEALKSDYLSDALFIVDTFQWTGAGSNTNWSNADNWNAGSSLTPISIDTKSKDYWLTSTLS